MTENPKEPNKRAIAYYMYLIRVLPDNILRPKPQSSF